MFLSAVSPAAGSELGIELRRAGHLHHVPGSTCSPTASHRELGSYPLPFSLGRQMPFLLPPVYRDKTEAWGCEAPFKVIQPAGGKAKI